MTMENDIAASLKGTSAEDVLRITKQVYLHLRAKVADGHADQADIAACNLARKEIAAAEARGIKT